MVGVPVSCVALAVPSAFAADVTVTPADRRAQLALPLRETLAEFARRPLSYQVYVDPAGTEPAAAEYGANLQLQVSGPTYTTLSFRPQLEGGAVAGAWKKFTSAENARVWRTSRDIRPYPAGSDHSLADYLAAEPDSQVNAAFLRDRSLVLEQHGVPLTLHKEDRNTYSAHVTLSGETLRPGSTLTAELSLLVGRAPCGKYTITGQLLSNGAETGMSSSEKLSLGCRRD